MYTATLRRIALVAFAGTVLSASMTVPAQAAATCAGKRATIVGTNAANTLRGTPRNDVIVGAGGNDRILGGGGADIVCGGGGNDVIDGGAGRDYLYGGIGNDTVSTGTGAGDLVSGGSGNDRITLRARGAAGRGGPGADRIVSTADNADLSGDSGTDTLIGGPYRDLIEGGADADRINGASGADKLYGDGGNDFVYAGPGNDVVEGGDGNDALNGDAGNDVLDAGAGIDVCIGGTGMDVCDGGSPGSEENTPGDPDDCDGSAEATISCRGGWPERMTVRLSGTSDYDPAATHSEHTTWSAVLHLVAAGEAQGHVHYRIDTGSGTFQTSGNNDACSIAASGNLDVNAFWAWLDLDVVHGTYSWEFHGQDSAIATWTCPKETVLYSAPMTLGNALSGLAWNPTAETFNVAGEDAATMDNDIQIHWNWSIVPAQD